MPSPEAPGQQPIEDIDAAREAAYAEKPARDYIAEYKDQLSDGARQSLEWIASQEADKALQRYEETKDDEDPVVRILRERALESLEFPEEIRTEITNRKEERMIGGGGVQEKQWIAGCEWALRDLGAELIEATLTDKYLEPSQKQSALERLGPGLRSGVYDAYRGRTIEARDVDRFPVPVGRLWGYFVGNLMANRGIEAVKPLQHQVNPRVLEHIMGFLGRARISHPEITENLDGDLSKRGWLWDKRKNTYLSMP